MLAVLVVSMAFGGAALWRLRFNYNFNDFYPQGDPELAYYERYIATFGTDNDYILVGLEAPGGRVFTPGFLTRVDSLTRYVRRQRHVRGVLSPTALTNPVLDGGVAFAVPYLHPTEPARLPADSALIRRTTELRNTLFSTDYRAVALLIQTDAELGKAPGDTLLHALTDELRRLNFAAADAHVAGRVVAQTVFVERLQWELALFISLAVVLVTGLLWLTFRTWWGVALPLLVVLLAVIWGLGAMGLAGGGINLLTALLPTMLFVVGMSDVVHILTRYGAELRAGAPKNTAVWVALREAAFGSGLSSLTTSIGFFTLATSNIRPIQDFGVFTGLAILLTFVLAFTLLPALLLLLPVPPVEERALTPGGWDTLLRSLFQTVLRRRRLVLGVAAALLLASVAVIPRIRLDATLLDDLAKDDPVRMDFDYFDQRFGGIRPIELHVLPQGGRTVLDSAVVRQIDHLETYLTTRYGVRTLASPATLVRAVRKAQHGGGPDAYRLPATPREWRQAQKALRTLRKRPEFAGLLTPDGAQGRLTGRLPDLGSAAARHRRPALDSFLRSGLDSTVVRVRLTGSAPLLDANNDNLTVDMLSGVSLDIVLVILITLALFRSWRMVPVVLIPNLFPLILVAGVMGAFDVNLKVSTSIIFTIAFGIAVDDTIHFIAKLRLALRQHVSVRQAVLYTYRLAGQAVIVTSLILIGGFGTLLFSSFDGTYYTGLLIGLTLLIGVVAELTLLPILILTFLRKKPVGWSGWQGWRRRARWLLAVGVLAVAPHVPVRAQPAESIRPGQVTDPVRCERLPDQAYALYLPATYAAARPWPVVYLFDPDARGALAVEAFQAVADTYGYVLAASNNSRNGPLDVTFAAYAAMRADVQARFNIDRRQCYVGGFSGGARAAVAVAARARDVVGVIGCGAGFPVGPELIPAAGDSLTYLGFVGLRDPNYRELREDEARWDALRIPHLLRVYDGHHDWPPATVLVEGFGWLHAQAMRHGRQPMNDAMLDSLYQQGRRRAGQLEQAGDGFAAWNTNQQLLTILEGLREVAPIRADLLRLEQDPTVQQARKRDQALRDQEVALQQQLDACYHRVLIAPIPAGGGGPDISCWRRLVKQVEALHGAAEPATQLAAQRLRDELWMLTAGQGSRDLEAHGYLAAEVNFRLAAAARPDSPLAAYSLAVACAAQQQKGAALTALERAVANGFTDAEALAHEAAFESLRETKSFQRLLTQLRAAPTAPATK